jgi:hypothetical protein
MQLKMSVDETTGKPLAAYLRIRSGKSVETREFSDGLILADYDRNGELIGVEFLDPEGLPHVAP